MKPTISVVQPVTVHGVEAADQNLLAAREYALRAARSGADVVCFPESYPGPWRQPVTWSPVPQLRELAREAGIHLVAGFAEPLDAEGRRCYNSLGLFAPDGSVIGTYRRTVPSHAPWIYKGGKYWDFDWVNATELPVFETDVGTIGLLVCSEIYAPELARILALKGAEILFLPAGLVNVGPFDAIGRTWRTLAWARAVENLAYTVICSNLLRPDDRGLAMVCSPEEVLLDASGEGIHTAEVDLERVRWLRGEQDRMVDGTYPWATKPGNLRDWRRQEVLDANPVPSDAGLRRHAGVAL